MVATEKATNPTKVEVKDLTIRYGPKVALEGVSLDIRENEIFGIIGPANSGKTSFLRALNRMDLFTPGHAGRRRPFDSTVVMCASGATFSRCASASESSSPCLSVCP